MAIQAYKKNLLVIALPIMLNGLISQVQMIIDRAFIGRLDILFMSAIGNATAPMWTTMSFLNALTMGATILISQAIGAGKIDEAKTYTASMFKFNNFVALILFLFWVFGARLIYRLMGVSENVLAPCLTYTYFFSPIFLIMGIGSSCAAMLQTCGDTKPLIAYGIIRSGLNILLDWLLIFGHWGGPAMGIGGAALATTISEFLGGIVLIVLIIRNKKLFTRPKFVEILKPRFTYYWNSAKLGIPSAAEDFAWNFGNIMMIRILNQVNEMAAGIFTLVFSIEIIPSVILMSLGNATLTLTGQEVGKKDAVQAKRIGKTSFIWSMGIAVICLVTFILAPKQLMSIFTTDVAVVTLAASYLYLIGINLFPKAGNVILGSGIRGYGDTKWMMYTQFFGTFFVIAVASLFVFGFKMGIIGVFCAVICDELVRCIINGYRFKRGMNWRVPSETVTLQ